MSEEKNNQPIVGDNANNSVATNPPENQPVSNSPVEPNQKIGLVWVFLGIGGVLLMWLLSSKIF